MTRKPTFMFLKRRERKKLMAENVWDKLNGALDDMDVGEPSGVKLRPAGDFQVATGPETIIQFEQQYSQPMDGSNSLLRNLSPFTLRVMPPLIYMERPALLRGDEVGTKGLPIQLGLVSNVASGNNENFLLTKESLTNQAANVISGNPTAVKTKYTIGGRPNTKGPAKGDASGFKNLSSPTLTDMKTAHNIGIQLERILNMAPLTLLINPESFQLQYQKIQQYNERTRTGIVFQTYGEEQPKMTFSGRIGAFYAGQGQYDPVAQTTTVPTGVQFASKRDSASFQQLMSLLAFYKNNGYIFDILGQSYAHPLIGVVVIDYDQFTYVGNFNSFNWGYEEAQHGGGIAFDLDFTVVQMYDRHQPQSGTLRPISSPNRTSTDPRLFTGTTGNAENPLPPPQPAASSAFVVGPAVLLANSVVQTATGVKGNEASSLGVSSQGFQAPSTTAIEAVEPVPRQPFFRPRGGG